MEDIESVIERLKDQVRSYRQRRVRLSEADTLRVLITPMLRALGWDIYDVDEVRNEYRHNPSDNPVDYALFLSRTPVLFVEAKALGEGLLERKWMVQTINYANTSGVEWCILTNGNEYRFYKVHAQVQVEDKLFLSVVLDDDTDTLIKARKLSLISRERMGQRAIDEFWTECRVDSQVRRILEGLPNDEAFLRLIAKKSEGLSVAGVRASLRRALIGIDFPGIGDVIEPKTISAESAPTSPESPGIILPTDAQQSVEDSQRVQANKKRRLMRTTEMFVSGLLRPGMELRIKGKPDSAATIIDGNRVLFQGEAMSFNAWGCRVTGWSAIQIYEWAELPDGRLMSALRIET